MLLDSKIPSGPIEQKWDNHKFEIKLVNPANKRKFSGRRRRHRAGRRFGRGDAGRARLPGEGITFHDSPRRGPLDRRPGRDQRGQELPNDGDSIYRLFYDTMKGGDYRSREANVYRLAQVRVNIIDQCVAQGVPFAREYGGLLDNRVVRRRAGFAHVLCPGPDRPAAAARRLPGAHASGRTGERDAVPPRRDARPRRRKTDGPRASCARDLGTGDVFSMSAPRRGPRHRRLRQRLLPVNQRQELERHGDRGGRTSSGASSPIRATRRSTRPASPRATTSRSKLTLMSESLRNDGRIWVPKQIGDSRSPDIDPRSRPRLHARAPLPLVRQPRPA